MTCLMSDPDSGTVSLVCRVICVSLDADGGTVSLVCCVICVTCQRHSVASLLCHLCVVGC